MEHVAIAVEKVKMDDLTGAIAVEKVRGKSTVTRCFSKYPLKFIIPTKAGTAATDAVWIYSLSYGGGIVSGDHIACNINVGDECTAILTTQASTKIYKSLGSKCSEQTLEVILGRNSFLALIPDPVTCFASARYSQRQTFKVFSDSSLVIVDWLTSGRHENGERWDFDLYKSINNIYTDNGQPILLDSVLLEKKSAIRIAESFQDYQVVAMIILLGPKLQSVQRNLQEHVRTMMSQYCSSPSGRSYQTQRPDSSSSQAMPPFIASCSSLGHKAAGLVVRIAASTTDSVYEFLRSHLASMEPIIGSQPYQ